MNLSLPQKIQRKHKSISRIFPFLEEFLESSLLSPSLKLLYNSGCLESDSMLGVLAPERGTATDPKWAESNQGRGQKAIRNKTSRRKTRPNMVTAVRGNVKQYIWQIIPTSQGWIMSLPLSWAWHKFSHHVAFFSSGIRCVSRIKREALIT